MWMRRGENADRRPPTADRSQRSAVSGHSGSGRSAAVIPAAVSGRSAAVGRQRSVGSGRSAAVCGQRSAVTPTPAHRRPRAASRTA